jgi:hypothetical protein
MPVGGSKAFQGPDGPRFTIEMYGGPTDLPRGHPNLYRLDLPRCRNIESLESALEFALEYVILILSLREFSEIATGKRKDLEES